VAERLKKWAKTGSLVEEKITGYANGKFTKEEEQ